MKKMVKGMLFVMAAASLVMGMAGCDNSTSPNGGTPDLSGNISISPNVGVETGTELTATYSGTESVSYQWKKDNSNVGTNSNKFTPTEAGSYTVIVSAAGYNSKTSAAVTVTAASVDPGLNDLSGNISISPNTGVETGTELTATYTGTESVTYQWKKDGSNVGTNSNKFTPTAAGSYTVTVSATGYNSKTSAAVTVTAPSSSGDDTVITIAAIAGVTAPVAGATPVTAITANDQYSGAVTWNGSPAAFAYDTVYTATITLTAKTGYTLQGVAANLFTVAGATATNAANSGVITAVFPQTESDTSLLTLLGNITISPNSGVETGTELTATYSGTETVSYQWKKDGENVGTNSNKYTPTTEGSYTVTVSATGYHSKTSAAVDVSDPSLLNLAGTVSITPSVGVETGTELTASYTGSDSAAVEALTPTYKWEKDGVHVHDGETYTPTSAGSYTVVIHVTGYNSKTSAAVTVTAAAIAVTGVSLDQATLTLTAGGATGTLIATVAPADATNPAVSWESSNTAVATVANGVVTPLTEGTTTITVKTTDGNFTDTCAVTVGPPPTGQVTVTIASSWLNEGVDAGTAATSTTLTKASSQTVVINTAAGYTPVTWFVNGASKQTGGNSYTFTSADKSIGTYTVTLLAQKDGRYYNVTITVTVQ